MRQLEAEGVPTEQVRRIQQLYPQVFHACHVAHTRRRSNPYRLSERDGSILAHIGPGFAVTARELQRHLGIGAPTLSAALRRLEALGYVERARRARSGTRQLALTARGSDALAATSVLDGDLLGRALIALGPAERRRAVAGLELLARACRSIDRAEERA